MRFNFVGKVEANSLDSKVPYFKKIEGYDGYSLNLACVASNSNRAFLEMSGFKNDTLKVYDAEGKEFEVAWNDRFDEASLKKASSGSKRVISFLDGTRIEYLSDYDFIKHVNEIIDQVKDKRFVVTGRVRKNVYKGKITDRFIIQSMFEIAEDDERKNQLRVYGEFFFNKDSIDQADFAKERKLYINGWTRENVDKEHKNVYVAKQIIMDCSKIDFNNEKHVARLNYELKQIGCALDGDKVVTKLKKGKTYSINAMLSFKNGAAEIEFDESQLTENQKESISLGINTIDDFKPKGAIYGERITSFFFKSWDLRDKYADGCIVEDIEDFDASIYTASEDVVSKKDFENAMNPPESDEESDDLFGD